MPKAYKLFRVSKKHKGKLFPLFVDSSNDVPLNTWLEAKEGEKNENGKVKSKLGPLAFRPGWHLSDIPLAIHIGVKGDSGKIEYMNSQYVWCECEYDDTVDYQQIANERGTKNGKIVHKNAFIDYVPKNGFYRYKTSPKMLGTWIIAGNIKILRVLDDAEVAQILKEKGYEPMPREGGPIDLKYYKLR